MLLNTMAKKFFMFCYLSSLPHYLRLQNLLVTANSPALCVIVPHSSIDLSKEAIPNTMKLDWCIFQLIMAVVVTKTKQISKSKVAASLSSS